METLERLTAMWDDEKEKHFQQAEARAMELALRHECPHKIRRRLEKEGYSEVMEFVDMQQILGKAALVRRMTPERKGRWLPRAVGTIALIAGIGAVSLQFLGRSSGMPSPRGWSPCGTGVIAIALGCILIFKPDASRSDL